MTYKEQFDWLQSNGFAEIDTFSGNSILWQKKYAGFFVSLYWTQYNGAKWELSILEIGSSVDVSICVLPDSADFTELNGLFLFFNTKCKP